MSKKQKKAKKFRLRQSEKIQQPPSELIRQGRDFLQAGNPRQAIAMLKEALKSGESPEAVKGLLFKAYLARTAQLRQKGMAVEARGTVQNALAHLPEASVIEDADLCQLLDAAPLETVLPLCRTYFETRTPSAPLLENIAGQLVTTRRWDLLDVLQKVEPLCADAPAARQAAERMHAGDWESALDALKPVRRTSPYAPVRILCRAMASFYAEDDEGMHRALGMIAEHSVFYPLARALNRDARQIGCLWDRKTFSGKDVEVLMDHLDKERIQPAASLIGEMARCLTPERPEHAAAEILMALCPLTVDDRLSIEGFRSLAKKLLRESRARMVNAKCGYFRFENPLVDTANYLSQLGTEFPDERQRAKAASLVLTNTAGRMGNSSFGIPAVFSLPKPYWERIGLQSSDPELNPLEILLKAIELDPANRAAYMLLARKPRYAREAKSLVETGLKKMMAVFAEDPFPCLELATLLYEKNAYRKAEEVLAEAKRRAPHDPKVTDRHVLALLISFEKRIRGRKLQLAQEDLEKARALCTDRTLALVTAKTIRFQAENKGQVGLFSGTASLGPEQLAAAIEQAVRSFSPFQRLSALGLIVLDLGRNPSTFKSAYRKPVERLLKRFEGDVQRLGSAEARDLLLPLERELAPVMPGLRRAGIYLDAYPQLLQRIKAADLPTVLEALVAEKRFATARKEIQDRLKQKDAPIEKILRFYLVVIRHLAGERLDAGAFRTVVAETTAKDKEMLRTASRRLAHYARGRLAEALAQFDFEILEPSLPFGRLQGGYDREEEEDDEGFMDLFDFGSSLPDELLEMMNRSDPSLRKTMDRDIGNMVASLEDLIDELGLRGLPGPAIHQLRKIMKRNFPDQWPFDILATVLSPERVEKLSREAWEFLYGR